MLESICVENGEVQLLHYHEQRMNRSRKDLWGLNKEISLSGIISPLLSKYAQGLYKCRVLYQHEVKQLEFVPYQRPQINSLKKVYSHEVDYTYKYAERESLTSLFQQKGECDDILIIKKDVVTDTYFANILFSQGGRWYTSEQPLLNGVQRQFLLDQGTVKEKQILEKDLGQYSHFKFVNALNPFDLSPSQPISRIF
ncbi:aminotransferase class IV [Catalinimonas alkaloidigena]|uniref:aminotransferase class IV n=1 Tax=Catalinimonas alkaloidigena TaxID=1075417 RepID=UPI0024050D30|nr:aminotransferase class IV [Catalinimonas alkaloidigena]